MKQPKFMFALEDDDGRRYRVAYLTERGAFAVYDAATGALSGDEYPTLANAIQHAKERNRDDYD
ncbi:MAG: hypothetical protein AAFU38_05815 [Bacteroidota bacterium]